MTWGTPLLVGFARSGDFCSQAQAIQRQQLVGSAFLHPMIYRDTI